MSLIPDKIPRGSNFDGTEIYLNSLLLGLQYLETKSGKLYTQNTMGWYRPTERGAVYYFMAGHRAEDFVNAVCAQIIANTRAAKPPM
jgi:hypothetical protein